MAIGDNGGLGAVMVMVIGFDVPAGPVPLILVAVTANVYDVLSDNPVMVSGLASPDTVAPPGVAVTV